MSYVASMYEVECLVEFNFKRQNVNHLLYLKLTPLNLMCKGVVHNQKYGTNMNMHTKITTNNFVYEKPHLECKYPWLE